jgi:2-polyprenyl-6-methoxyphenol hydroxylase-like FAD-dependent oxidoreductase
LYFFDGGYCGVQPIAPGIVNACAMVRSDRATTLDEVFALHRALRARAQTWRPIFAPISTAPLVFRAAEPIRPPLHITAAEAGMPETGYGQVIICVGDAAAFIDPFVGDGISLAIRTGVAAAEALGPQPDGDRSSLPSALAYAARYERDFVPILKSAARVRSLFYKPRALRLAALTAMRLPFVADYVIRRTRAVT